MTVLAFSLARFTPSDLAEFNAIAEPNIGRGLWDRINRSTGRDFDRIQVKLPIIDRVVFSFERDRNGHYQLYFHDNDGRHCIGNASTAADCLAIWRRRRLNDPVQVSA